MKKYFVGLVVCSLFIGQFVSAATNNEHLLDSFAILENAKTLEVQQDSITKASYKFLTKKAAAEYAKNKVVVDKLFNSKRKTHYIVDKTNPDNIKTFLSLEHRDGLMPVTIYKIKIDGYYFDHRIFIGNEKSKWTRSKTDDDALSVLGNIIKNDYLNPTSDALDNNGLYYYALKNSPNNVTIKKLANVKLNGLVAEHFVIDFKLNSLKDIYKNYLKSIDYEDVYSDNALKALDGLKKFKADIWIDKKNNPVKFILSMENIINQKGINVDLTNISTKIYKQINKPTNIYAPTDFVDTSLSSIKK